MIELVRSNDSSQAEEQPSEGASNAPDGKRLTWLHLTDLHLGGDASDALWPNVCENFYQDLEVLLGKVGAVDVIFFTGDLVNKGKPQEYNELDRELKRLGEFLSQTTKAPAPRLYCVPGNHDLVRPDAHNHNLKLLLEDTQTVRDEFWKNPDSPYRTIVNSAFSTYAEWYERASHGLPLPPLGGLLPGDFSHSFNHGGSNVAVVGLNTTAYQLTNQDFLGKLNIHINQFHQACGGNGPAFIAQNDIAFLLTHHPKEWLNEHSRRWLDGEINLPGRFAIHLFGHMHEARSESSSLGGAALRTTIQGPSLFGLQFASRSGTLVDRVHGYSIGQLDLASREFRLFPRVATKQQAGGWKIGRDQTYNLADDGGTHPVILWPNAVAARQP